VYHADVSDLEKLEVSESMEALRSVIEKRVNAFGVTDPVVQSEESSSLTNTKEHRLIVELPGVTDTQKAIDQIGETPVLEFKLKKEDARLPTSTSEGDIEYDKYFEPTKLTGRFLDGATVEFGGGMQNITNEPMVILDFNKEGGDIFKNITEENTGRILAIFLDGRPISTPVIQEVIPNGRATISGNFKAQEAKELARDLNFGALPVPIELRSSQTIGATLGHKALDASLVAALWAFAIISLFMVLWYRLPGIVAIVSLSLYIIIMLSLAKFISVTITSATLAGFVLSLGMAVDANVLIFERVKEELKSSKLIRDAVLAGFGRAWPAIRDGNASSVIISVILFWFGTSLVEGFALTFGVGVLVSMFTAVTITRTFLLALSVEEDESRKRWKIFRFLFGSGIK
ncbi:MAG: protein translocase subunit SecD, partial [Perlabentimonas sp.]